MKANQNPIVSVLPMLSILWMFNASEHGVFPTAIGQERTPASQTITVPAGINKEFLDPDLNVEDWQKRFEVESREVYASRKAILAALELKPGKAVADVGAGTGLFTQPMSESVGMSGRVYAVDISPVFVKHLRKLSADEKLSNVEVIHCDDRSTGLPADSVDVVFICDTYHHFDHPMDTLKSIKSALKPGGILVMVDFDRIEGKSREWTLTHVRAGKDDFRKEIEAAGLKFVDEVTVAGFKENYLIRFRK